ncbi:kinase-like domain-containing protein [Hyaloraphidium curvatum]|nr:kinase-like domain-containing protein [Hyaloraphidium curvatum]
MLDDSAFAAGRARRRRYRILERVGQGSEAKVSAALSLDTGRMVAIKVSRKPVPGIACPTEQARTFAAIAALKHPNIVEMIEQFETESKSYTVMELAAGDLETFLQCRGPLGEAEIRTILASILRALCFLHSRGIAHRDLKPRNILLRSFDDLSTLCISDFGGAHVPMGPLFPPPGVPTMHRIVGTPLYLAPEIVRGQTPYSAEVDLWSLGCIAYQLAWGRTPFGDSDSLLHLFARAIGGRWSFPTGARQGAFADFVAALLRPDPEGRISAEGALEHPWMKGVPVVDGPMYSPAPMPAIEALEVMGGEKGDTRRFSRISV